MIVMNVLINITWTEKCVCVYTCKLHYNNINYLLEQNKNLLTKKSIALNIVQIIS